MCECRPTPVMETVRVGYKTANGSIEFELSRWVGISGPVTLWEVRHVWQTAASSTPTLKNKEAFCVRYGINLSIYELKE